MTITAYITRDRDFPQLVIQEGGCPARYVELKELMQILRDHDERQDAPLKALPEKVETAQRERDISDGKTRLTSYEWDSKPMLRLEIEGCGTKTYTVSQLADILQNYERWKVDHANMRTAYLELRQAMRREDVEEGQESEALVTLARDMVEHVNKTFKDLNFVTNEEMVEELTKRHDAVLIVLDKRDSETEQGTFIRWSGGIPHAMGLARYGEARIHESRFPDYEDAEEDED